MATRVTLPASRFAPEQEARHGQPSVIADVRQIMKFRKRYWLALPAFLLFTLVVYAPIHEASHYFVGRAFGWQASEVRLVPRFWKGEIFKAAYVSWSASPGKIATFCVTLAPYLVDIVVVMLGRLISPILLARYAALFWASFLMFVWGPAFNTIHNFVFTPLTHTDITAASEATSYWFVYPLMIGASVFHILNFRRFARSHDEYEAEKWA